MTMQISTPVRNAMLDAIETTAGTAAILKIRTGTPPAACSSADTGTVVATLNLPSDWMANAANASKSMSGTWQDSSADATGTAGHYRIYASDGSTCHVQGIVAQNWAASTAYTAGTQRANGGNLYQVTTAGTSAASGGPTGTATSITDGTATWSYVGPADLAVDNVSFAVGQSFTINSYVWSIGGA